MVEDEPDKNITLWCERLDPTNPDMLSCEIIPNPVPTNKGLVPDASLKTPLPDQAGADAAKPSSGGSSDAKAPGYKNLPYYGVRMTGKSTLKSLNRSEIPEPVAGGTPPIQKIPPAVQGMGRRLGRLKKCNDPKCRVTKPASVPPDTTAQGDKRGDGGK